MTHATPFKQEDATRLLVLAALVTEVTNDREPVTRLSEPCAMEHLIQEARNARATQKERP